MSVDLIKEIVGLKTAYVNMRGADRAKGITGPPAGQPISVPNTLIPRTTWADILIASAHIKKYVDPTPTQCIQILTKNSNLGNPSIFEICNSTTFRGVNPRAFVKTPDFIRAMANFRAYGLKPGVENLGQAWMEAVYPYNEEFWGYAIRLAIAREAAGAVPFWNEIAVESISEAIQELPETLKKAATEALATIDPRKLIPDVSGIVALIKWGSVAGALGLLYWYVLRPKKK